MSSHFILFQCLQGRLSPINHQPIPASSHGVPVCTSPHCPTTRHSEEHESVVGFDLSRMCGRGTLQSPVYLCWKETNIIPGSHKSGLKELLWFLIGQASRPLHACQPYHAGTGREWTAMLVCCKKVKSVPGWGGCASLGSLNELAGSICWTHLTL